MRSFLFAIGLLVALLAAMWGYTNYLEKTSEEFLAIVDEMDTAAKDEDWERADAATKKMDEEWEELVPRLALFTDHDSIDEVMQTIAAAKGYVQFREEGEFMAEIKTLRALIEHIPKREALTLYNIF